MVEFAGNQIVREDEVVDEIEGKIEFDSTQFEKILSKQFIEKSSGILPINFST